MISVVYHRGAQPFWAKGHNLLFLGQSRAEDKIIS